MSRLEWTFVRKSCNRCLPLLPRKGVIRVFESREVRAVFYGCRVWADSLTPTPTSTQTQHKLWAFSSRVVWQKPSRDWILGCDGRGQTVFVIRSHGKGLRRNFLWNRRERKRERDWGWWGKSKKSYAGKERESGGGDRDYSVRDSNSLLLGHWPLQLDSWGSHPRAVTPFSCE